MLTGDDVSECGVPVPVVSRDGRRDGAGARRPHLVHRRAGLRDLGRPPTASSRSTTRCVDAGADLGLRHFGARALNSLRLEKSFGNWAREYRPIYTPAEAGLDRFVDVGEGGLHRPRRACCATARGATGAPARHVRRRRGRRRRDRRRAGVARRQGRRLDHLGRLRALRRKVDRARLRAGGARAARSRLRDRDPRRAPSGSVVTQPLHDPTGERMRRS